MAEVGTLLPRKDRRYFFILSTDSTPLRCSNMSKDVKTIHLTRLQKKSVKVQLRVFLFKTSGEFVSKRKGTRPGVSFQYLYRVLWPKPTKKWNSIESCFCFLNGNAYSASAGIF